MTVEELDSELRKRHYLELWINCKYPLSEKHNSDGTWIDALFDGSASQELRESHCLYEFFAPKFLSDEDGVADECDFMIMSFDVNDPKRVAQFKNFHDGFRKLWSRDSGFTDIDLKYNLMKLGVSEEKLKELWNLIPKESRTEIYEDVYRLYKNNIITDEDLK